MVDKSFKLLAKDSPPPLKGFGCKQNDENENCLVSLPFLLDVFIVVEVDVFKYSLQWFGPLPSQIQRSHHVK